MQRSWMIWCPVLSFQITLEKPGVYDYAYGTYCNWSTPDKYGLNFSFCSFKIVCLFSTQINIDSRTRDLTYENVRHPEASTFEAAQKRIESLMGKDSYPRFIESDLYLHLLSGLKSWPGEGSFGTVDFVWHPVRDGLTLEYPWDVVSDMNPKRISSSNCNVAVQQVQTLKWR